MDNLSPSLTPNFIEDIIAKAFLLRNMSLLPFHNRQINKKSYS